MRFGSCDVDVQSKWVRSLSRCSHEIGHFGRFSANFSTVNDCGEGGRLRAWWWFGASACVGGGLGRLRAWVVVEVGVCKLVLEPARGMIGA